MLKECKSAFSFLFFGVGAAVSPTYTSAEWATVGGWSIDTHRSGCYLQAVFEGEIEFAILLDGLSRNNMTMDIFLFNRDWRSINEGSMYDVEMAFDRGADWTVEFEGISESDGSRGLHNYEDAYIESSGTFAQDFMRSNSVYISFEGKRVANLNLDGSRVAFEEMVECQRSLISSVDEGDPFAESDPFR